MSILWDQFRRTLADGFDGRRVTWRNLLHVGQSHRALEKQKIWYNSSRRVSMTSRLGSSSGQCEVLDRFRHSVQWIQDAVSSLTFYAQGSDSVPLIAEMRLFPVSKFCLKSTNSHYHIMTFVPRVEKMFFFPLADIIAREWARASERRKRVWCLFLESSDLLVLSSEFWAKLSSK